MKIECLILDSVSGLEFIQITQVKVKCFWFIATYVHTDRQNWASEFQR